MRILNDDLLVLPIDHEFAAASDPAGISTSTSTPTDTTASSTTTTSGANTSLTSPADTSLPIPNLTAILSAIPDWVWFIPFGLIAYKLYGFYKASKGHRRGYGKGTRDDKSRHANGGR